MVVSAGAANAGDLSLEESILGDTSNVTEEESQRITSQMRAAAYYLGNKDVTEQQAKERYQISHSPAPQPQQRPPPPPSPPTSSPPAPQQSSRRLPGQATAALIKASSSTVASAMDRPRVAPCRARTTALTPRPVTMAQPQQPRPKQEPEQESVESDPGFRPGNYVETGGRDDYWYRTSHVAQAANQNESETSSTPPVPQSQSQSQSQSPPKQTQPPAQSQSQSQSQSQPQPSQVRSPPASPPRQAGPGLVQMLSQLSTSDTSQEHAKVLVPDSFVEKESPQKDTRTSGIVDYPSDQSDQSIHVDPQPDETQATLLQTQLDFLPSRSRYTPADSRRGSSPSLGGSPVRRPSPRSSPSLGGNDQHSSLSLGGPSPSRPGGFAAMNMTGGSSPYQPSSAFPTQNQESLTQEEEDDSGTHGHGTGDTQATAATQIVSPEDKYLSATPAPTTAPVEDEMEEEEEGDSGLTTKSEEHDVQERQATPETQIVSPEEPAPDVDMGDANVAEETSLPSPPGIATPNRVGEFVRLRNGSSSRQHSTPYRPLAEQSTLPLTTPLTNPQQTYALDRSRKSAFEPPVRTRPEAQVPIRRINFGGRDLSATPSRLNAMRAEEEERALRRAEEEIRQVAESSARERERPTSKPQTPAANEVLTASTPFVSGKAKNAPQRLVRSPLSPQRVGTKGAENEKDAEMDDAHDTEPEEPESELTPPAEPTPIPPAGPLVRNQSSQPLEVGRQERLKNKQLPTPAPPVESDPENESEDEAPPQTTPQRGRGKQIARRGRGRGRGRGGASATPRTPHEVTAGPASPLKSGPSTNKKRPRAGTIRDASPAGVAPKKPRVQAGSSARAATATAGASASTSKSPLTGTRVLAWWSNGKNYYFGTITGCETQGLYSIQYDDGDSGTIALDKLRRPDLRAGDRVRVNTHDKSASHRGEAVVKDVRKWKSDHIVGVLMGNGERVDMPAVRLMVQTKEVKSSWSNRMLDEDVLPPPPDTKPFAKRRVSANTSTIMSSRSGKLAGYAFVLTLKAEDVGIRDDKLEEWKVALRAKIETQGGVVADEWDELFTVQGETHAKGWTFEAGETGSYDYVGDSKWPGVRKVFLLSGKVGTTAKYMMALALGVPCLSHKWVDDFLQDESTPWSHALLTCGQSDRYGTFLSQVIEPRMQKEPDMVKALVETQLERRPFGGKSVLCIFKKAKKIQKDPTDKGRFFSRVACVLGATVVHLIHDIIPWPIDLQPDDFDFVLCETPATQNALEERGATCRSLDWVKQCIIMGRDLPVDDE